MKKLLILFTVLLVLGSACKKDFLNIDETNPNSASAVPANLVLPAALNTTARIITQPDNYNFIYLWYGCWCISGGYSQPTNLTQYNLLNSSYQGNWDNLYLNLQNYDYIEKNSTGAQASPYRAIAKIMKAYIFQTLVDTYGNVPYSQALKGSAANQNLKPAYDNQQDVYDSLVVQLDKAMDLINTAPSDAVEIGAYDIVYNGDMGMWLKFANTLKLRMLVNQSGIAGRASYITGAIATTPHTTADYIGAGEGALANPGYSNSANKMNPFWENFYKVDGSQQADGLGYTMAGQDACDFLINNNDPRKLLIFAPYSGTSIKGNYFGALLLGTVPTTSQLGPGLLQAYSQSAPLLTDFESLFLQAEAAQKGLISGTVKDLYESGVTQSVTSLGGLAIDAAAYLAQAGKPLVNFTESTNPLETIITQKWIALNGIDPMPIWTDYRRTHYPSFIHFSQDPAKLNPTPPVRLLYPQTEISTNNDNVVAQGSISLFTSHIFWDPNTK
jgi:Starch-binding associating with outer membrane